MGGKEEVVQDEKEVCRDWTAGTVFVGKYRDSAGGGVYRESWMVSGVYGEGDGQ